MPRPVSGVWSLPFWFRAGVLVPFLLEDDRHARTLWWSDVLPNRELVDRPQPPARAARLEQAQTSGAVRSEPDVNRTPNRIAHQAQAQLKHDRAVVQRPDLARRLFALDDQPARVVADAARARQEPDASNVVRLAEREVEPLAALLASGGQPTCLEVAVEGQRQALGRHAGRGHERGSTDLSDRPVRVIGPLPQCVPVMLGLLLRALAFIEG